VSAAVLAAGVVAGGFDWTKSTNDLQGALADTPRIRVADLPAADGLPARGVFAQVTAAGLLCLTDASLDAPETGGGGCNAADDPLGGSSLSVSLAYDGGPAIESVRDARLIGLAATDVVTVRVVMSDGSWRRVRLVRSALGDDLLVLAYRFRKSDLRKGIGPVEVVAYDRRGAELGRQPTGIG
jgi:hypothetical protein